MMSKSISTADIIIWGKRNMTMGQLMEKLKVENVQGMETCLLKIVKSKSMVNSLLRTFRANEKKNTGNSTKKAKTSTKKRTAKVERTKEMKNDTTNLESKCNETNDIQVESVPETRKVSDSKMDLDSQISMLGKKIQTLRDSKDMLLNKLKESHKKSIDCNENCKKLSEQLDTALRELEQSLQEEKTAQGIVQEVIQEINSVEIQYQESRKKFRESTIFICWWDDERKGFPNEISLESAEVSPEAISGNILEIIGIVDDGCPMKQVKRLAKLKAIVEREAASGKTIRLVINTEYQDENYEKLRTILSNPVELVYFGK